MLRTLAQQVSSGPPLSAGHAPDIRHDPLNSEHSSGHLHEQQSPPLLKKNGALASSAGVCDCGLLGFRLNRMPGAAVRAEPPRVGARRRQADGRLPTRPAPLLAFPLHRLAPAPHSRRMCAPVYAGRA